MIRARIRWARTKLYDPVLMTKFHTWSLLLWALMVPVTLFTGLRDSIPWLAFLSVWALATGSWAALQGAHGEKEQDRLLGDLAEQVGGLRELVEVLADEVIALRQALGSTSESPVSK